MLEKTYYGLEKLASDMVAEAHDGFNSVAVLFYEDAKELIHELFYEDVDIEVDNIELLSPVMSGYTKEYYVTLTADLELSVEQAYGYSKYLGFETECLFIDENACSSILAISLYDLLTICTIKQPDLYDEDDDEYDEDEYEEEDCEKEYAEQEDGLDISSIHFAISDDDLDEFVDNIDVYVPLLMLIGKTFEYSKYEVDDYDDLLVDIDTHYIFDMMREF